MNLNSFCAVGSVISLAFSVYIYAKWMAKVPRVHANRKLKQLLLDKCSCLVTAFQPTWWCPFGTWQTIFRQLLRSCPLLPFDREVIRLNDGGQLGLDWLNPPCDTNSNTPIVIFLLGIAGSTHECSYVLHTVQQATKLGYRSLVVNARGLGGVPLLTPLTYSAATTHDLAYIVEVTRQRFRGADIMAVGYSLGGMILYNYLAKCESIEEAGVKGALIISSPWEPHEATISIEQVIPRLLFNRRLAHNLKQIVTGCEQLFSGICDWKAVMAADTVRQFDKAFTVPVFGYRDIDEYYDAAEFPSKIHKIPVPTVCLNAADDCFAPLSSIPLEEVEKSENVAAVLTAAGGHTAFMTRSNPNAPGLVEQLFVQFSEILFCHL